MGLCALPIGLVAAEQHNAGTHAVDAADGHGALRAL